MGNFSKLELQVSVGSTESMFDQADYNALANELFIQLNRLDGLELVDRLQAKDVPSGAKGTGLDLNTIFLKLSEVGAISSIITVLGTWLARDKRRILKLQVGDNSLEVTGLSKEEQQKLIQWFQVQTGMQFDS